MSIRFNRKVIASVGGGGGTGGTNTLVDNKTIVKDSTDTITAVGVQPKKGDVLYDWIGTLEEYEVALADGTIQENWLCYVTDDVDANSDFYKSILNFSLFDTKISDHILEGNEAKGWALQGTYVTKESYPDFYNKCLEEYKNTEAISFNDYTPIELSNYSASSGWSNLANAFDGNETTYATCGTSTDYIECSFATETTLTGVIAKGFQQEFVARSCNIAVYSVDADNNETLLAKSNNASINGQYIASVALNNDAVNKIRIKLIAGPTGDPTTAYKTRIQEISFLGEGSAVPVFYYQNPNGHRFYNITDKSYIDTIYGQKGIADFYGIDEENERVFLPRNKHFFQLTDDLTKVNEMMEAGLPNIEAHFEGETKLGNLTGAFTTEGVTQGDGGNTGAGTKPDKFRMDASLSNPIYGNSDTVQPPSSLKLLYYCVGNTEVTQAITNVAEATTTENDTIPLFTGMYFDFKPNNVSWLKAGEQQNSGGIYKTCYNTLVEIVNGVNNFDLKVINQADMVSGVIYDEYWILNQDNLTFRTPLTIATKSLSGGVVGNGIGLGITDGTNFATLVEYSDNIQARKNYGENVGVVTSTTGTLVNNTILGVTTDPTKSGIVAEQSTAQLYFKVANAVQNLELLDVSTVMEQAVLRSSLMDVQVVIESYENDSSWYRVWSNGWCEQGGCTAGTGSWGTIQVTLLKEYKDANYTLTTGSVTDSADFTGTGSGSVRGYSKCYYTDKTSSSFKVQSYNEVSWYSCGYLNR